MSQSQPKAIWVTSGMYNFPKFFIFFAEPTGAVGPRVNTRVIDIKSINLGLCVVLICPAQAYPVPLFR